MFENQLLIIVKNAHWCSSEDTLYYLLMEILPHYDSSDKGHWVAVEDWTQSEDAMTKEHGKWENKSWLSESHFFDGVSRNEAQYDVR